MSDRYAIVCNYAVGTKVARPGAKAYYSGSTGGDPRRVQVTVRTRGGRFVTMWDRLDRLTNVRVGTVPPEQRPPAAVLLFDTRAHADGERERMQTNLINALEYRARPREFHDPGDEDRR